MSIEENLTRAINAHSRWKKLLKTAIENGECSIDVETTSKKDACGYGKWLYTDEEAKKSPRYATVEQLHAQFHHSAGEILALALSGRTRHAVKWTLIHIPASLPHLRDWSMSSVSGNVGNK